MATSLSKAKRKELIKIRNISENEVSDRFILNLVEIYKAKHSMFAKKYKIFLKQQKNTQNQKKLSNHKKICDKEKHNNCYCVHCLNYTENCVKFDCENEECSKTCSKFRSSSHRACIIKLELIFEHKKTCALLDHENCFCYDCYIYKEDCYKFDCENEECAETCYNDDNFYHDVCEDCNECIKMSQTFDVNLPKKLQNLIDENFPLDLKDCNYCRSDSYDRYVKLIEALSEKGLILRDDSVLCRNYIILNKGYTMHIANRMAEMRYLYEHTDYSNAKDEYYTAKQAEHFVMTGKKYPKIWPWIVEAKVKIIQKKMMYWLHTPYTKDGKIGLMPAKFLRDLF